MTLVLPNPGSPANGQPLDANPLLANQTAIAQAIQLFDGTQIQAGTITNASAFSVALNPVTRSNELLSPFVSAGCSWLVVSGLQGTMAGGVIYVNGIRIIVTGVASKVFTASQDTYVSIDVNANISYSAVANGATAPALPANSIWVAVVVTNGTIIYSINDFRILSFNSPWQLYGPTITAGSGTFTTVSATNCYFKRIGTTVQLSIQINVASNGTAASSVIATLPFPANTASGRYFVAYGREDTATGKMLQGVIRGSGLVLTIFDYINNYPVGGSGTILMFATYEAA